jgi:hypothetical protein
MPFVPPERRHKQKTVKIAKQFLPFFACVELAL